MVNLNVVLYVPQAVNNLLVFSRSLLKGAKMGDTKDKINIKKNGVNMILDTRKQKK